jgi:hypothetical protein
MTLYVYDTSAHNRQRASGALFEMMVAQLPAARRAVQASESARQSAPAFTLIHTSDFLFAGPAKQLLDTSIREFHPRRMKRSRVSFFGIASRQRRRERQSDAVPQATVARQ